MTWSFQSTRPHGARHPAAVTRPRESSFQSTRPHGARPDCLIHLRANPQVSIHAPARGATRNSQIRFCQPPCFNPRARTGRDPTCVTVGYSSPVSIHAPARGATAHSTLRGEGSGGFNPRARTGRDLRDLHYVLQHYCFNPRARTGRDATYRYAVVMPCGFNPRARTGRDL